MMAKPRSFRVRLNGWSDSVNRWVEISLFLIGFAMASITGIQVFCRYLLNHSLFWSEEVGRICLVWLCFLGATSAYKRHAHLGIDFLVRYLEAGARRFTALVVVLASQLFFGVLIYYGAVYSSFVALQKTPALGIPKCIPYLVIPLSGVVFSLHALNQFIELLHGDEAG